MSFIFKFSCKSTRQKICRYVKSVYVYSISTLNSDIISKTWDKMRIKFGCNDDKI